jgi:hypothetical protein
MVSEESTEGGSGPGEGVLTVEEAARILRIGRGTAYAQARRWRETKGREGLPVIVLGRSLRVPRVALQRLLELNAGSVNAGGSGR